jgi:hypothetical protein
LRATSRDTVDGARPSRRAIMRQESPAAGPREISSRSANSKALAARRGGRHCTPPDCNTKARTDGPRLPSRRAISRSDSPRRHRCHTSSCSTADSPHERMTTSSHQIHRRWCIHPWRPPTFLRYPPLPRPQHGFTRPEPVSRINVAQPGLSQGSATVVRMRQLLGYARVSTTDQQPHLQGRRPPASRLVPGVHRDRQRRPHRPSDAPRALLNGSLHRPLGPAAHQFLDLAARQALGRTCPMIGCLGRCRRPGSLLEARWSVATVCDATLEPLAFGALQRAGRQHGPDRRPHPSAARASSSSGAQRRLRRPATLNWQQHEAVRRVEAA